ncbi:MAG TPA: tetratricopeptide repeat protein [Bacteroidetes bacterium]|nr:tetratricopeptide repeat protein [Bacteroidota bacterium]HIL57704.1 tetratricopeptide repeat protein [Rhodothermales bacterium]
MPTIATYDTDDFERDVLSASRETPVLVDFWAPWCGPCRVVGPVLESLATEEAAKPAPRWTLAKVNTDEHPELMQRYGIRGIPAMKLFADGEVIAEVTGALPEYMLKQWLNEHLPTETGRRLALAREHLASGDLGSAVEELEAAVSSADASGPDAEAARTLLARLTLFDDPERARQLTAESVATEALATRTVADALARDSFPEGDVREAYAEAHRQLRAGHVDEALAALIGVLQRDRAYDDDGARKLIVALFQALGEDDPVVRKHRPVFDRSLY